MGCDGRGPRGVAVIARTAEQERALARRLESEARRAEDEGRGSDAERLYARSRLAWRSAAAAGLAEIGGAR